MEAAQKKLTIICGVKLLGNPPLTSAVLNVTVNNRNTDQNIIWINIFKGSFIFKNLRTKLQIR